MRKLLAIAGVALACGQTAAAAYPDRAITMVVPFSAGGPTDVVARHLAQAMSKDLGQAVIVENRPSAGGIVGSESVVQARPDGYTLLIHNIGMSTLKALSADLRFDPQKDFAYIGQIVNVPMTLVGATRLPAGNFRELAQHLRANQQRINIANAGIGTASHLCGLLLMSQLGLAMTTVPYKGAAPAMTDLQGGQVDLLCDQLTTTLQPIKSGRVKAYGSTTRERLPLVADLPTLDEQGLTQFEVTVWHGLYAPKETPTPITERLSRALQSALSDTAFQTSMTKLGAQPVGASLATPRGLQEHLRRQSALWTPLIQKSSTYLQ